MKPRKLLHLLVLVASVCFLFAQQSPARGQVIIDTYITDLDCSAFPTITLNLRAVDSQGDVVSSLDPGSFTLLDNGIRVDNPQVITEPVRGPKHIVFSLDRGKYSNLNVYQDYIKKFMRDSLTNFNDGIDRVTIVDHTSMDYYNVIKDTESVSDTLKAINELTLDSAGDEINGFRGLQEIYDRLVGTKPERYNTVIVHFSRLIAIPPYDESLEEAKTTGINMADSKIKVYVFQTDQSGNESFRDAYKELASSSNGIYVFIPDDYNARGGYKNVLSKIDRNSMVYEVQFTSPDTGPNYKPNHTISVAKPDATPGSTTDSQSCKEAISIQKFEVGFVNPANTIMLDPNKLTNFDFKAKVTWQESNKLRKINNAELRIDGINTKATTNYESGDFITFSLDTQSLLGLNIIKDRVKLTVWVEDNWGWNAENTINVTIASPISPSVTASPPPSGTKSPTGKTPVKTQPPDGTPEPKVKLCPNGVSVDCAKNIVKTYWFYGTILGIILILFILLISTRRQLGRISAPAREAIGKRVEQVRDQVRKTLLGGSSHRQEAIAYLHVLMARNDRVGAKIEIYNNRTTLGRDPSVTDVQLYNPDDKTSVSGLHCTIFYDLGKEKFLITDDNSTNGTYVNGKRLVSNDPVDLNDGDEIILGDIYRQGAKLRFEIAAGHPEVPLEEEAPPIEEDFNVDLESTSPELSEPVSEPPPAAKEKPKKDFDETVPGYREEEAPSNQENDSGRRPPSPPTGSLRKKGKDKSWQDQLS